MSVSCFCLQRSCLFSSISFLVERSLCGSRSTTKTNPHGFLLAYPDWAMQRSCAIHRTVPTLILMCFQRRPWLLHKDCWTSSMEAAMKQPLLSLTETIWPRWIMHSFSKTCTITTPIERSHFVSSRKHDAVFPINLVGVAAHTRFDYMRSLGGSSPNVWILCRLSNLVHSLLELFFCRCLACQERRNSMCCCDVLDALSRIDHREEWRFLRCLSTSQSQSGGPAILPFV